MPKPAITIKASNFTYPTKEERKTINDNYPKLKAFSFESVNEMQLLNDGKDLEDVNRRNNLYWWNNCLQSRLWNLYQAYINTATHYNRGVPEVDKPIQNDISATNLVQFNFYSETYYYYFASTRDILMQILNIYYQLGIKEEKVDFNKVSSKMTDPDLKAILLTFQENTKKTNAIRNTFTHKFSANRPDYRTVLGCDAKNKTLSFKAGRYISNLELMENINKSLGCFSKLLENLHIKLIKDG